MKKLYLVHSLIAIAAVVSNGSAQTCTVPNAPTVSGATIAACTPSNSFTLTATNASTLAAGWYTAPYGGNAVSTNSVYTTPSLTSGATYYAGFSSSVSTGSISLPAFSNGYSGNTRGMWFTAPVSFVITGLRVPTDVGTGNTAIAVMKFGAPPPAYSSTTNSFNILYMDQNYAGTAIIPVNIPVWAGDVIGILGARSNVTSYGPTGPYTATLGSNTLTLARLGMQYQLSSTTPQDLWTESTGNLGRIEVYTTLGCLSSLTPVTVSVVPNPVISIIGPPGSICSGNSTTLTATGLSTYTWSTNQVSSTIAVNPTSNTTYTVNGSLGASCSTVAVITVSVDNAVPTVSISATNNSICIGNTVALTGAGTASFVFSGGVINNVPFSPTVTTVYTASATNGCGTSTANKTITVNPLPTLVTSSTNSNICEGQTTTITATGGTSYTWQPGGSNSASIAASPMISTSYTLTGSNSFGCITNVQEVVIVNPTPTVNTQSSASTVCVNGTATLSASGSANTYSWNGGPAGAQTVVSPSVTTTYTVVGEYVTTGCTTSNFVTITVFQPTLGISSNTSVCLGSAVTLTAGPGSGFVWSTGSPFSSITVTPNIQTVYTATGSVSDGNIACPASNSVQVGVMPNPTVDIVASRTVICKSESVTLQAQGAASYTWNTTSTATSVVVSPVLALNTYTVKGVDGNGCSGTASVQIKVNSCQGIAAYSSGTALQVYPNPSAGEVYVMSPVDGDFRVLDELGREIAKLHVQAGIAQKVVVHSPGVYFVIGLDDLATREKFIISR